MPKFSRSISDQTILRITAIKTYAILAVLIVSTLTAGQVACANDWVPDKSVTETFDLTAVPALGKNSNNSFGSNQNAGSNQSAAKHAPYLMLSTPSTQNSASARPTKSAASAALRPSKTREYDVTISDFEATTDSKPAPKKNFLSRITAAPARAIGVTCGVCVGVPVSIARDTRKYTGQMKKSMNDGLGVEKSGDMVGHMFSGACAVPFGIGSGLVHGSVTGVQRAMDHGKTQPFSKESMSLGAQEKSLSNRPDNNGN